MPYFLILLALLIDRLTKWWAVDALAAGPLEVHPWLTLRLIYNRGVAFGIFQGSATIVGWVTVPIVIGMAIYLLRLPRHEWITRLGLGLLIGGALGNMVDRITAGEVVDFFQIPLNVGIFNVADIAVNAGMIIVILGTWYHERQQQRATAETAVTTTADPPPPNDPSSPTNRSS